MKSVFDKSDYRDQVRRNIFKVPVLFFRDLKYCKQRIQKGYCDKDLWSIFDWFLELMPEMLTEYKNTRHGSPSQLIDEYGVDEMSLQDEELHSKWDTILDQMIFLLREANEETCQRKNPYEKQQDQMLEEYRKNYNTLVAKYYKNEKNENDTWKRAYLPSDFPEYREIDDLHYEEWRKLRNYRDECKTKGLDLFNQWFWALWD